MVERINLKHDQGRAHYLQDLTTEENRDRRSRIQHDPQTQGGEKTPSLSLTDLIKQISKSNPGVNLVRAFVEIDDVASVRIEFDFSIRRIGFEEFRFGSNIAIEY